MLSQSEGYGVVDGVLFMLTSCISMALGMIRLDSAGHLRKGLVFITMTQRMQLSLDFDGSKSKKNGMQ
jgi:hypothetical protein